MSGFDASVANSITKRIYDSKDTVSQLQDQAPYIKGLKKIPAGLGAGLYGNIQLARNQSIGIRNSGGTTDNEALPSVSQPAFDNPTWDTVRKYVRITMTGKGASRTKDEKRAFASGVAFQIADAQKSYWRDQEFCVFNGQSATSNKSGLRGVLDDTAYAAAASVTFTLDVTATSPTKRRYAKCKGIPVGARLDVYDGATWTKAATIVVSAVDASANTFTGSLDNSLAGTADKWFLFREGDFNRDVYGLLDLVDDGTLGSSLAGVSTAGLWKGWVLDNAGTLRDLTVDLLDEAVLLSQEENDQDANQMWMNFQMYRKLLTLHQRSIVLNKEMGGSPVKANLGGSVETWDGAAVKKSSLVPANTIFLLQTSDIALLEQVPFQPVNLAEQGQKEAFWQRLPGYDTWEAVYVHEYQQMLRRRNLHVQIGDLNQ